MVGGLAPKEQPKWTYNFQQRMSRFPQRWRTQRNAIRNANCKTSWIIKILNAHCASGIFPVACLPECLYNPTQHLCWLLDFSSVFRNSAQVIGTDYAPHLGNQTMCKICLSSAIYFSGEETIMLLVELPPVTAQRYNLDALQLSPDLRSSKRTRWI